MKKAGTKSHKNQTKTNKNIDCLLTVITLKEHANIDSQERKTQIFPLPAGIN